MNDVVRIRQVHELSTVLRLTIRKRSEKHCTACRKEHEIICGSCDGELAGRVERTLGHVQLDIGQAKGRLELNIRQCLN